MNLNLDFQQACNNGLLEVTKELLEHHNVHVGADLILGFILACSGGHLDVVQWLISDCGVDPSVYFYKGFVRACRNGHIEVVKWLLQCFNSHQVIPTSPLYDACNRGDYDVIDVLLSSRHFHGTNIRDILIEIAQSNNIRVCELVIRHFGDIDTSNIKILFDTACEYGNLNLAKWIMTKYSNIDFIKRMSRLFRTVCCNGDIDVAQWFCDVSPGVSDGIKINYNYNYAQSVVKYQWLDRHNLINDSDDYKIFRTCCRYGHIDVCKWILSLNKFVVDDDKITDWFELCIINNNVAGAKWLSMKYPRKKFTQYCMYFFIVVCQNGWYDAAEYIIEYYSTIIEKISEKSQDRDLYRIACGIYCTNNVQLINLLKEHKIDLKSKFQQSYFVRTCKNGNLQMAQYIVKNFHIKNKHYESAFVNNTNHDIILWLCEIRPGIATTENIRSCFVNAVYEYNYKTLHYILTHWSQHLDVPTCIIAAQNICVNFTDAFRLDWLFKICPEITGHPHINLIFISACKNGNFDMAKYLLSTYTIDLTTIVHKVFVSGCVSLDVKFIDWLYSVVPNINIGENRCEIFKKIHSVLTPKIK